VVSTGGSGCVLTLKLNLNFFHFLSSGEESELDTADDEYTSTDTLEFDSTTDFSQFAQSEIRLLREKILKKKPTQKTYFVISKTPNAINSDDIYSTTHTLPELIKQLVFFTFLLFLENDLIDITNISGKK
jgi:hypothetical protein